MWSYGSKGGRTEKDSQEASFCEQRVRIGSMTNRRGTVLAMGTIADVDFSDIATCSVLVVYQSISRTEFKKNIHIHCSNCPTNNSITQTFCAAMARKSKQPGGNMPLTAYERTKKFKSSNLGTTTVRLSTDAQGRFGDCELSLSEAIDPVATCSGHIYSREAIVQYLLTTTMKLKDERITYDKYIDKKDKELYDNAQTKQADDIETFENSQKATTCTKKRPRPVENVLTGYWMAEHQPEHIGRPLHPPPTRPPSPSSGNPLRRKDLIPLIIKRRDDKVLCAISDKIISTQPAVALCGPSGGHVILEELYTQLIQPTMICPITSQKLKVKHILKLVKGRSGFASSGTVEAKIYRPTIT